MKRIPLRLAALLLSAILLSLAGCGSDPSREFTWAMMNAPAQTAAPEPEAVEEDTILHLTMPAETGVWNPIKNESQTMQGLMTLVFEPLVRLDNTMKPVPCLAEGWKVEEDGTKYTFYLRGSVYFPDGSALTARDVARSLDEILIAGEKGPWYSCLKDLVTWIPEDDKTFVVTTARAGYDLIYQMTFPVVRAAGQSEPLGTGPYRVEEYVPDQRLSLTAQNHWWKQPPLIADIEAISHPEPESELAARAMGDADFVRTRDMTAFLYRLAGVTEAQDYLTQTYDILAFNFERPIMAEFSLRKAIDEAIDRKEIISSVYQNHAVACEVPVPPDHWLHEAGIDERISDVRTIRESLEQAGFADYDGDGLFDDPPPRLREYENMESADDEETEDGNLISSNMGDTSGRVSRFMSFTLLTNYHRESPLRRDAALRIADQLKKIGLDVKVREVDIAKLPEEIAAGDYDMLLIGYQMPVSGDLSFLLSSEAEGEQSGCSITHYSSEPIEALLNIAHQAKEEAAYRDAVAAIQKRLAAELPFIGLYFRNGTAIFNARLAFPGPLRERDPFRNIEQWRFTP